MNPQSKPRLCVLISGGGTTLQNFIDRIADGRFDAEICGVVSSKADAFGVERAKRAGLPVTIVTRSPKETFNDRVFAAIREFKPDIVCLAGWLHLLSIPADFKRRVINIHPSLLPAFGGKGMYGHHVHEAVLASGDKESGCTVHYADDEYDTGPIITQRRVPVLPGDTPEKLAARVFEAECEAYPEGILLQTRMLKRSKGIDLQDCIIYPTYIIWATIVILALKYYVGLPLYLAAIAGSIVALISFFIIVYFLFMALQILTTK